MQWGTAQLDKACFCQVRRCAQEAVVRGALLKISRNTMRVPRFRNWPQPWQVYACSAATQIMQCLQPPAPQACPARALTSMTFLPLCCCANCLFSCGQQQHTEMIPGRMQLYAGWRQHALTTCDSSTALVEVAGYSPPIPKPCKQHDAPCWICCWICCRVD